MPRTYVNYIVIIKSITRCVIKRDEREMKTIDERHLQKTTKENQKKTERSKGNRSSSERVRAKWFCCPFKLGFFQLICKASLIFKSNLELALSIVLKQRELYTKRESQSMFLWSVDV